MLSSNYGDLLDMAEALWRENPHPSTMKIAAGVFKPGDEVRIRVRPGSTLNGTVLEVSPTEVMVENSRTGKVSIHPIELVTLTEDLEAKEKERNDRDAAEREIKAVRDAEQDALQGGGGRTPGKPTKSPIDFSNSPALPILKRLGVDVRLYWQDHYDTLAREWAAENGVPVDGCVANKFGERGGHIPQWGICGRVTVKVPENPVDLNLLIQELSVDTEPMVVDGKIVVNGYRIAAGLAKVGFPAHS